MSNGSSLTCPLLLPSSIGLADSAAPHLALCFPTVLSILSAHYDFFFCHSVATSPLPPSRTSAVWLLCSPCRLCSGSFISAPQQWLVGVQQIHKNLFSCWTLKPDLAMSSPLLAHSVKLHAGTIDDRSLGLCSTDCWGIFSHLFCFSSFSPQRNMKITENTEKDFCLPQSSTC